jgi:hypothetical protein
MTRAGVGVTFPTLAQGRDASPVASPCEHPVFQARPICQAPSGSSGARRSPPPEPGPFHLSRPSSRKGVMPGGRYSCGVEKTGQVVDRSSDREEAAEPASACLLASTNPDDHSGRDRYQPAPPPTSESRSRPSLRPGREENCARRAACLRRTRRTLRSFCSTLASAFSSAPVLNSYLRAAEVVWA